jgi:uncharacterized protein (TIGR02145 family)
MKKLLLLSALLIFACSSDDSSNTNDNINNNELLNCDGNPVPTIVYGTQEWTVENACHTTYRDGTPIPQVVNTNEWRSLNTGAWCYYDNNINNGVLYNWYAVKGIHDTDPNTPNKEFAPDGWHVPSDAEWTTFQEYLIDNGYNYDGTTEGNKIAKAISSQSGWLSNSDTDYGDPAQNQENTNNSSGFNIYPIGNRYALGGINSLNFHGQGFHTTLWTTDEYSEGTGYSVSLDANDIYLYRSYALKRLGVSVRLVKD